MTLVYLSIAVTEVMIGAFKTIGSCITGCPVISTTVWGTVVIILSLLVLGGVIYMFVKPTKGNKNGPKGGQRTEKKEQDSKIQV